MTDIVLTPVTSGYRASKLNGNFDTIKNAINGDVLHLGGGNNVMRQDLDMNSFTILNASTDPNDPTSLATVDYVDTVLGAVDAASILAMQGDIGTLQTDVGTLQGSLSTLTDNVRDVTVVTVGAGTTTLTAEQSRAASLYITNTQANGRVVQVAENADNAGTLMVYVNGTYTIVLSFPVLGVTHTLQPQKLYVFNYVHGVGAVNLSSQFYTEFDNTKQESFVVACSDEATAISTTGDGKVVFRMPYAFTLSNVRASLSSATTTGVITINIRVDGVDILSPALTIDATEKTSRTAATAVGISSASVADDAEVSIDLDGVGDSTAKGLKVTFYGTRV